MRLQKDLRVRIESLLSEGERLIAAGQFPEAVVKLGSALELDPGNTLARERLRLAEQMTRDAMIEKSFPNQPPVLTFLEPPPQEMEGRSFALLGVATDDRGLAKVEYRVGRGWWPSTCCRRDLTASPSAASASSTCSTWRRARTTSRSRSTTPTRASTSIPSRCAASCASTRPRPSCRRRSGPRAACWASAWAGPARPPPPRRAQPLQPLHRGRARARPTTCSSGGRSCSRAS